ncbi:MAG: ribonuclease HII, partial [Candidatus Uhrbacteria bacterium]|nr:ribonuclease HII [Candidatus Uhrbacteria bacterium]
KIIEQEALAWGIGEVSPAHIDAINIHRASLLAMRLAVDALHTKLADGVRPPVLIDGRFTIPHLSSSQEAIVDGDADIFSIAAASIIAKEHRDALMHRMHDVYPAYGFDRHVGYATKQHREAIFEHGITPEHRVTFCKNFPSSVLAQTPSSP